MTGKVAILMSTYNGEQYLEEQIKSIINQTYKNWTLYIRDDGSKDGSVKIIQRYASSYDNIIFLNDKEGNLGVSASFMKLLKQTIADYYMFSDQDDVWLNTKIKDSLNLLKLKEPGPVCVFTDAQIANQNLKPLYRMNGKNVWTDFLQLLFANCVTGCTMIFNQDLKKLINFESLNFRYVYVHDWWIALIAAQFGKLFYLNKATLLYRQHGTNVIGSNKKNTFRHILHRFKNMNDERQYIKNIINLIYVFNNEYGKLMKPSLEKEYVINYAALKKQSSFLNNLRLIKKFPPQRINLKGKIFFSYLLVFHAQDYLLD